MSETTTQAKAGRGEFGHLELDGPCTLWAKGHDNADGIARAVADCNNEWDMEIAVPKSSELRNEWWRWRPALPLEREEYGWHYTVDTDAKPGTPGAFRVTVADIR